MAEENTEKKKKLNQVKMSDVLILTLKRWPWLLLSVVLCVGLAYLNILRTQPVFTRTATILVKDDQNGSSYSSGLADFADLGILKTNNNVVDEINKLTSFDLMKSVVESLNLQTSYGLEGRFRDEVLYGSNLPVTVSFPSLTDSEGASLKLHIAKNGTYTISDLNIGKEENIPIRTKGKVKVGQAVSYPGGVIEVKASPFFKRGKKMTINVVRMPLKAAVNAYSKRVDILLKDEKGNTLTLTATDTSPARAEDVLAAVIRQYNDNWMSKRAEAAASTQKFIAERLAVLESELGVVDDKLAEYRTRNLLPDEEAAAELFMKESHETNAKITELNSQLQNMRYMRSFLSNSLNKQSSLPSASALPGSTLDAMVQQYNLALQDRNQIASNSSDSNPLVMDRDRQLAEMRTSIQGTIDAQERALETQMRVLTASREASTARVAAAPTQARDLTTMGREQNVKQRLYLYLLQKREENELTQTFTGTVSETITEPTGDDKPVSPSPKKLLAMALFMGLMLPLAVNYTLERLNTKVRTRKDLEDLRIPILGEIPRQKLGKAVDPECAVVVEQGKRDLINEAFRMLRTNLNFISSSHNSSSEVIMITSFNPGSGKSFIGANLGIALAIRGKKVMLIDGDLRHMSTSMYVGSPRRGLVNYLAGDTDDLHSLMVCDSITKNLCVLPVGTTPPNPAELLESPRFAVMISTLRWEFDYIFIDCPPVEMMADAQIISNNCDRTIFVVRAGLLDRYMLPELARLYEEKKVPNMSLVLNAVKVDNSRLGGKYGYGYGYGNYNAYAADTK